MQTSIRIVVLVMSAVLAFGLLGCDGPEADGGSRAAGSDPSETVDNGSVSLASYMADRYASFTTFDKSIRGGKAMPRSLRLYVANGLVGMVHDEGVMADVWKRLCEVRIQTGASVAETSKDDAIIFDFDSGGETIPFPFRTTACAYFAEDAAFAVEDPEEVQAVLDELKGLVVKEEPQPGEVLTEDNGAYFWDADGDGSLEHMWLDFYDNGDEAPSGMEVRVFGNGVEASGWMDHAYTIREVRLASDDEGPYVIVSYDAGDYYAHDHDARCTIRLVGDELEITEQE